MLALSVSRISSKTNVCAQGRCQHYPADATGFWETEGRINPIMGRFFFFLKEVWTPLFRNEKLIPKCSKQNTSRDVILSERHKFRMIIACYLVDAALF